MNLLSQSKLTLKLKKPNSTLTTTSANECQKQGISDSLKSENLLNNSIISVNDSFVEVLSTPQLHNEQISMSQNVFISSTNQNNCIVKNENKSCPICLLMVCSKNFINHVKSCGISHNVSSEVLIKAVDLQERQTAEREALGLPKINISKKKQRKNPIKQSKLKVGSDSNLDLAIAMSASLQESKVAEIIKESETLLEAGLEKEAIDKRKTLESFGFISNQQVKSKSKVFKTNSILFKQTKEDREKRITEKIAIILLDSSTDISLETLINYPDKNLRSKYLNKIRNIDNKLWKKSSLEENNETEFYVKNLSKFIIPCESYSLADSNSILKPTLQHVFKQEPNPLVNKTDFINISTMSPIMVENNISTKWKSMVGNRFMSDIICVTKNEYEIYAHILVLYVHCPNIMEDIIVEYDTFKSTKKMIMWVNYSYESCLAFLKYIYTGEESSVSQEYIADYLHLRKRYNFPTNVNNRNQRFFFEMQNNVSKRQNEDLNNSSTRYKRLKASSSDMFMSNISSFDFLGVNVNDEQSLSSLKTKQWLNSCNGSQQYANSLFTENLTSDVPLNSILLDTNSNHSFHSASTVSIKTFNQNMSDHTHNNKIESDDIHINTSESKPNVEAKRKRSVPCPVITKAGMPPLTSSSKIPELIIINDSESESIDMSLSNNINEHQNTLLSRTTFENLSFNSNCINTIELNDDKDSIHSASTNILNQTNYNKKSHPLFIDLRDKPLINIDDGGSVFSAVTNVLSSNNNIKTIDLVDDSSNSDYVTYAPNSLKNDDLVISVPTSSNNYQQDGHNCSTSFSNGISNKRNLTLNQENLITNRLFDQNKIKAFFDSLNITSNNVASNNMLSQCEDSSDDSSIGYKSSVISSSNIISGININSDGSNSSEIFSTEKNDLYKPNNDSEILENTIKSKSLILPSNHYNDPIVKTNNCIDLTSLSAQFMNNHSLVNTTSTELSSRQMPENINVSTILNENDDAQHKFGDNDWKAKNNHISYTYKESNLLLDETKVQTPKYNYIYGNDNHLNIETPTISVDQTPGSSKKNYGMTPNKYGSKINTPSSLCRVQSESVIGSNDQLTPLPDYSIMETPDLRKEFDRYGLKDLGRRKGKLILRHIYDSLHPSSASVKDKPNIEPEVYSDLSDISDHGIPDYEDRSREELETFSQTSSSNKMSVEMGFKQILRDNQDLYKQILCYRPIWIEELKENLKQYNVSISIPKLMTFLDDKCVTFRSKSLNYQRQKPLPKNTGRKKLF